MQDGIRHMVCDKCGKQWDALCYESSDCLECPACKHMVSCPTECVAQNKRVEELVISILSELLTDEVPVGVYNWAVAKINALEEGHITSKSNLTDMPLKTNYGTVKQSCLYCANGPATRCKPCFTCDLKTMSNYVSVK